MACESMRKPGQTLQSRIDEVRKAITRLEASIQAGRVKVAIGPNGAVAFSGWADRDNVTDACAFRTLTASNSWALRQAVVRAEAMSGRKVNTRAVAEGHHSHDGGKTWERH
jgi:methylaspartate ammonia-lyase